ncbi:MAG: type I-E CRISPR-associated endoribonuclease Cas2e [Desulfarculales bacterium]|jgi:CRISPR-associated protein Cas2|nr:type I-E CRISPR-associated endoribonuclease Cas2e [Desulfarculales bacterium]
MIVIVLTDCPPALRGDLSRWLQEINTGVYVGQVSARVREELWKRVRENSKSGRAAMVFSANNEQGMDFRVHNTQWEPIDFDGLKLILRPSQARIQNLSRLRMGFSNAAKMRQARRMAGRKRERPPLLPDAYVVIDVETTGLSAAKDEIIEIGALKVQEGRIAEEFHALIKIKESIPPFIESLTGISNHIVQSRGRELTAVMPEFLAFIGRLPLLSHNVDFDCDFLRMACEECQLPSFFNQHVDTLLLAKKLLPDVENHKLATLLEYFGIAAAPPHRGINDCMNTKQLYEKLIELWHAEKSS